MIDQKNICSNIPIAGWFKLSNNAHQSNYLLDRWFSKKLVSHKDVDCFIGLSGMSLNSIIAAH